MFRGEGLFEGQECWGVGMCGSNFGILRGLGSYGSGFKCLPLSPKETSRTGSLD